MERIILNGADFEDVEHAHRVISDHWVEHELRELGDARADAESRFALVGVGAVKIATMELAAPVEVVTSHPGCYSVNVPLKGHVLTRFGSEVVDTDPHHAVIDNADTDLHIPEWDSPVFCFRVDEAYLQMQYERVLARPFRRLPFEVDLSSPAGRDWHRLVRANYEQMLASESTLYDEPVLAEQLASTMTTALLLAAACEERDDLRSTHPRIVRRVVDAIRSDPGRSWTIVDLAELAGVSVRRLQQGFREHLGRTPFQFLRETRLDRAHHDLVHAAADDTVTEVALRWGLTHAGRFAADYRQRFGRSPSDTLRG